MGIAFVLTVTNKQQQGTILLTLNNDIQVRSQPTHIELTAIIIEILLRKWHFPQQQGDTIYSDCKTITDVINSSPYELSEIAAKLPFLQATLNYLRAKKTQRVTLDWT